MRCPLPLLAAALASCATEKAAAPASEPTPTAVVDPAPYVVEDTGESATPSLSAEDVAAGITRAFSAALAVDPRDLADAYEGIWAERDEPACPYYYPEYLTLYNQYIWSADCTSEAGATFDGYAYYQGYQDYDGGYYTYDRYFYLYTSAATLTRSDGQRLTGSGYAYYYDIDYYAYAYKAAYSQIQGTFAWEGASFEDSWLARSISMDLYLYSYRYDTGQTYTTLNGSLADIDGGVTAVNFDSLYLENAATGTSCAAEPGGAVLLRDTAGTWYEVSFDGPAYSGAPSFPAYCDGCGSVYWRGDYLGEACPDFSSLTEWQDRPWE